VAESVRQLARFGLAGLVNTAVGFAVVVVLDPVLGVAPALANAIGYLVGVIVGFALNRGFVFRSQRAAPAEGIRYVVAAASAFVLNQGVLRGSGLLLGPGSTRRLFAQMMAMAVYSATLFFLCRFWVFRPTAKSRAA
jgi:putative flippase GtrA